MDTHRQGGSPGLHTLSNLLLSAPLCVWVALALHVSSADQMSTAFAEDNLETQNPPKAQL